MGSEELEYDEFQPMWDEVKETLGDKKVVLFGSYSWAEGEWMDNWKADATRQASTWSTPSSVTTPPTMRARRPAAPLEPSSPSCNELRP